MVVIDEDDGSFDVLTDPGIRAQSLRVDKPRFRADRRGGDLGGRPTPSELDRPEGTRSSTATRQLQGFDDVLMHLHECRYPT